MKWKHGPLLPLLVILTLVGALPAESLAPEQVQKILPDDGSPFDHFGGSVFLNNDTAVIGASSDGDNGRLSGSAYVFVRSGGVWSQQAKLLPDDGSPFSFFGGSVSLEVDTAVIGASRDDANGLNAGSAYVFVRSGGVWTQQAKLLADDGARLDSFGTSISVDGDTIIIGARGNDDNGPNSGSAYVFFRSSGMWTQQTKLLPDDGAPQDSFGDSVSIDGDTVVIGARGVDAQRLGSGSAYVFVRSGGVWTQQAKLLADDGASDDDFGDPVSLDGDTAVIGAPQDDDNGSNSGSAYVFVRSSGVWTQQAKLLPDDGAADQFFGIPASVDDDTILISASLDDDNGLDSGSAYVFVRSGGVWTQQAKLLADDGAAGDVFGAWGSLDGDTAVIGAFFDDDNGLNSGSAYVFRLASPSPVDLLNELIEHLSGLGLHYGTENSLRAKLHAALMVLTGLVRDNDAASANILGAFIRQAEAQRGKFIAEAVADGLISDAQEIVELLGEDSLSNNSPTK